VNIALENIDYGPSSRFIYLEYCAIDLRNWMKISHACVELWFVETVW
jgi:hypothetical protein